MKKDAGLQYVSEFSFSKEQGFTGSAGVQHVKGYARGGHVKTDPVKAAAQKHRAPGPGAARGGHMKDDYSHGGTVGVTTERGPKSKRPKDTMTKAARGGSMHDKLYAEGGDMGYARGGQVKDTSGEFDMTSKAQDTMDSGVQPKRKGRNQASIEAGGTKRVKLKFGHGGGVHKTHHARRKASKKSMPRDVKAEGGLAKYAEGGGVNILGTGGARGAARAVSERQERVRSTVKEALSGAKKSKSGNPRPQARTHDKAPARKAAPGSQRGRRGHYGMPFKSTPMVK